MYTTHILENKMYVKKYLYLRSSSLKHFDEFMTPRSPLIESMCNHIELHSIVCFTVIKIHVDKYEI